MGTELREDYLNLSAKAAFYSAANAVTIVNKDRQSLDWWACGAPEDAAISGGGVWTRNRAIAAFATFVEASPGAPAEALYRWAGARGFHQEDPAGWEMLATEWRLAFGAFVATLPVFDALLAAEVERQAAAVRAEGPAPLAAALTEVPIEDTILRGAPDPLETSRNMVAVLVEPAHDPDRPDPDPSVAEIDAKIDAVEVDPLPVDGPAPDPNAAVDAGDDGATTAGPEAAPVA